MKKEELKNAVSNTANLLELVSANELNTANTTGSLKNIVANATNKLNKVVKDATIGLKDLVQKASSDLTLSFRKIAKASAVCSFLLLGTMSIYSTEYHIVGAANGNYPNEITWTEFIGSNHAGGTTGGAGNTYILTGDVGTPNSTILNTPVSQKIGNLNLVFRGTFDGGNNIVYVK